MNMELNQILNELISAVSKGKSFTTEADGMKISADMKDNTLSISMKIDDMQTNEIDKERNSFENWVAKLPDDIFLPVCEELADDNLDKIQECLKSNNIDTVRSAILRFKKATRDYVEHTINKIAQECKERISYLKSLLDD